MGSDGHSDSVRVPNEHWNPKEALSALVMESRYDDGDQVQATARMLREHAIMAAQSIAHLSAYGDSERVRLQASTFIVEKVLASELDHDLAFKREQVRVVGQALFSAMRSLGLRYGFEPDSPEARQIAHEALLELSRAQEPIEVDGKPHDATAAQERASEGVSE